MSHVCLIRDHMGGGYSVCSLPSPPLRGGGIHDEGHGPVSDLEAHRGSGVDTDHPGRSCRDVSLRANN